jgi:hypothetical protein
LSTDTELGKIMASTFNPGTAGGWRLSNGDTTASSPNNNVMGAINAAYGANAIPDDAKTYYEFTVSGAAVQTAFGVGFGEVGSDLSNIDLTAEGKTITNSTFVETTYNGTITNGGNIISDPQDNADRGPAPNTWGDGTTIGVEVDRVNNQVTFLVNDRDTGTFSIAALAHEPLVPLVASWFRSGPVATINGNPSDTPAGYTNLDGGAPAPTPTPVPTPEPTPAPSPTPGMSFLSGNDAILVNQPSPLLQGQVTIVGQEPDPMQAVFLDWHTYGGAPAANASDWVQADVHSNGNFRAVVSIDHPGVMSTMYERTGGDNTVHAVWSGVPS